MGKGAKKPDAAADLAPISAAQRVEHYEIAGYTTARNLSSQLRHSAVNALLSLMSVARMPAALKQAAMEEE